MQQQFFGVVNGGMQWAPPIPAQFQAGMQYQIFVEPMQNVMADLDLFIHNPITGILLMNDTSFNSQGLINYVAQYTGIHYLTVNSKNAPTSFRLTLSF